MPLFTVAARLDWYGVVQWSATITILLAVYSILLAVYRITFHPLASFPGPKLAAMTRWYEAYFDLVVSPGGQFSSKVKEMHKKYGPIVRINPSEISVQDPDFHQVLYAPQPAVRDKYAPTAAVLGTTSGTFGTVDHYIHRKRRAANSNFFSPRNIALSEPLIQKHVDNLCSFFRDQNGAPARLRIWFMALKLDIFFEYAFADELGLLAEPSLARHWDDTMEAISYCAPFVKMFPDVMLFANRLPVAMVQLASPTLARVLALNRRIKEEAVRFAAEPERFSFEHKIDKRPATLFQTLHESALPTEEKQAWRVAQEGAEMFAAAGTTSRVLSAAIFHLYDRPETLQLLRKEIDKVFPNCARIPENAVIRESLRMGAPVATRLPLLARSPILYGDWEIPAGTPVSMNSRDMLHDPEIFPDPYTFKPERWQVKGNNAIPENYFVPFGKGARICQGRELAMYELQITLAVLIRRFEFELVDTVWERDVKIIRDCFVSEPTPGSKGVQVRVVRERM